MSGAAHSGRLDGKVAAITGGSSGIGLATARLFARNGAAVVLAARGVERGTAAAASIAQAGGRALFVPCDVRVAEQVEHLVAHTDQQFGRLDILFNHAGVNRASRITELAEDEWDELLDTNAKSVYLGCRYAIPLMIRGGGGSIINTAGTFGLIARPAQAAYCASKAAVIHLTRQVALEYGPYGVRVNCICPGYIDTPLTASVPADIVERLVAAQPIRRVGQAQDVAYAALYLASEEASFVTGGILPVDGGQLLAG